MPAQHGEALDGGGASGVEVAELRLGGRYLVVEVLGRHCRAFREAVGACRSALTLRAGHDGSACGS